jgi:hypothetical protein
MMVFVVLGCVCFASTISLSIKNKVYRTMLVKFAVTNYRGFANRIEWDLSKPSNYSFNTFAIKDGIIKNGIVYGPNGSGKSNFAMAIFDITNHLSQKWKKVNYYDNFTYTGKLNFPVKFEYAFKFMDDTLLYTYSKSPDGKLEEEELVVNNKLIFCNKNSVLTLDDVEFPMDSAVKANLANNANNVSIVNFLLTSYPLAKEHYLLKLQQFVNSMLWFRSVEKNEFMGLATAPANLDEYIIKNQLTRDFEEFIHRVSGQSFEFQEPKDDDKELYCVFGLGRIPFDKIASTGTQSLMLLYYWLKQMANASFVFIDEFDAFYHFRLSYEVCKTLFALPCQAFTSSHNTYLMTNDLLRPDCNFILQDNKIKPLSDCTQKELRFGHNIEKMFRGNAFEV